MKRFAFGILAVLFLALPAQARQPEGYSAARDWFMALPVNERLRVQMLLTAADHWPAVPNVNFGKRLFDAIEAFQSDYGFPATGALSSGQRSKLEAVAAPLFRLWGFREAGHPYIGRPIWIPFGLGLQAKRIKAGIEWSTSQVSIRYQYFENMPLNTLYQYVLEQKHRKGQQIPFSINHHGFFVVSSSSPS